MIRLNEQGIKKTLFKISIASGEKKKKKKTKPTTNPKPPCRAPQPLGAMGPSPAAAPPPPPLHCGAKHGRSEVPRAAGELLREGRFSQDFTSRGALGAAGGGLPWLGGPGEGREQRHVPAAAAPARAAGGKMAPRRRARWER